MDSSKRFEVFLTKAKGKSKVNWEQVRIQAAIAAMQWILSNSSFITVNDEIVIQESVKFADALVKELKGEKP